MKLPSFLVGLVLSSTVIAQQPGVLPPLVTTNGSALIHVTPDLADLYFEVEVRGLNLSKARQEQAERATKVLAALRAAGVIETELQTSQARIAPDYTERRQETDTVKFYRVVQSVTCTVHDLKKVPDITAAAVSAGATGVREASLRTTEWRKHRDEARVMAIRAAKEKAQALVKELGATLGRPYTVSEEESYPFSVGNINSNAQSSRVENGGEEGGATGFAPGTIDINANVRVAFLIE